MHDNVIEDDQFVGVDTGVRIDSQAANTVDSNTFAGGATYGVYVAARRSGPSANTISGSGAMASTSGRRGHRQQKQRYGTHQQQPQMEVYDNDVHDNTTGLAGGGTIGPASSSASTRRIASFPTAPGIYWRLNNRDRAVQPSVQQHDRHRRLRIQFGEFRQRDHGNVTGLSGSDTLGPADWSLPNDIHDNSIGVATAAGGVVCFNRIHNNNVGKLSSESGSTVVNRSTATRARSSMRATVSWRTADAAFYSTARREQLSRTILSIRLEVTESVWKVSTDNDLRGNIVWTENGYDLYVANDSQQAFDSDYNNLFTSERGRGRLVAKYYADIFDWMIEPGHDQH